MIGWNAQVQQRGAGGEIIFFVFHTDGAFATDGTFAALTIP